jgi:hypothetical protein
LTALGLLCCASASAQTLGPLIPTRGGNVFNGCTADQAKSQPGRVYVPSAIEPWIAVDPTTTGHLLIGVQQDRWDNGGSRGLRGPVSVDGGRQWTNVVPPDVSQCTGGKFQRSTDPWTAFDLNGTAYFFSLAFDNNPSLNVNGESAMLVSRSTDGGASWGTPTALIDDTDPLAFNDKNSLSTDPNLPGYVYAVWDRLYGPPLAFKAPGGSDEHPNTQAQAEAAGDGVAAARHRIAALRQAAAAGAAPTYETFGPTYYARSTDSGHTWERAVPIYDPGRDAQTIDNYVVGLPKGDLLDFFDHITARGELSIGYVRSVDHGFSWTRKAVTVAPISGAFAVTPDGHKPLRDASILYSVSVDPVKGGLYIAWEDVPQGSSIVGVLFTESLDGGVTWSTPVKINATPPSTVNKLRGQAFNPTIVAAQGNWLVATYYDFRNDVAGKQQELADAWVLYCKRTKPDACTSSSNWTHEQRLTNTSFNIVDAVRTQEGYFLGDYFGLATSGRSVWPAFTLVTGVGKTGLFTRPITMPASP